MQETPVQFLGQEDPLEKGQATHSSILGLLVAQLVKHPSAVWETWVLSVGWEEPLEKGMATHSSILAWKIPCTVQFDKTIEQLLTMSFFFPMFQNNLYNMKIMCSLKVCKTNP